MKKHLLACFLFIMGLAIPAQNSEFIDRNFEFTKLDSNIYLIKSAFSGDGNLNCNHLLITDPKDIVLVNTPVNDSLTSVLLNCVVRKFRRPVTKIIVSHFHEDSSGGLNETRKQGIVSYGLDKTADLLKPSGKNIDMTFSDTLDISLQNCLVKLYYFGAGHSADNILVWLPVQKILFGGCLLKALSVNNIGNTKDADPASWVETVKKVKERCKDAKIVIPGHMEYGNNSVFDHTIEVVNFKK
jgi:metallo-beta-lactamase class B